MEKEDAFYYGYICNYMVRKKELVLCICSNFIFVFVLFIKENPSSWSKLDLPYQTSHGERCSSRRRHEP